MTERTLFDGSPDGMCTACGRPAQAGAGGLCWVCLKGGHPGEKAAIDEAMASKSEKDWHGDVSPKERRKRLSPQCLEMLAMLRRGNVTNAEFSAVALKYTGRISDLRAAGHDVRCIQRDRANGKTVYALFNPGEE